MSCNVVELSHSARIAVGFRSKVICTVLSSVLLLAGITAIGSSFTPFSLSHAKARNLSATGQIPFFTHDFYREMQFRLRVIGTADIAAALVLFLLRRRMFQFAERVLADSWTLGREIKSAARMVPAIELAGLAGLLMFAILLRIPLLWQPMRYDEAYTFLQYSSHPFYAALSFYNAPNNHLLNTLLVRLAYLAFGNHPWAFRLPAFVAGVGLVPASYIAARSLYRSAGALLAAGLVSSSSRLIEYSTNARGYIIVCLVFMVLIPLSAYALRNRNWAAWLLIAILSSIGFYAVPIMLYPFGGLIIWLLASARLGDAESQFRSVVMGISAAVSLTAVLTAELYSPVLAVSGPRSLVANKWVAASPWHAFIYGVPLSLASTWRDWNRSVPLWLSSVLATGFFISLMWNRRCGKFRMPLAASLIFWIVPLICVQRVIPFERVWLFALPLYFITSAAGLATLPGPLLERIHFRNAMAVIALAVSSLMGFRVTSSHSAYLANDCRGLDALATYLKAELKSGDSVVAALPSDVPLYYYFQKEGVPSSFINAPFSQRGLVVVNEASGDTLQKVLDVMKIPGDVQQARLLIRYDSASLYELLPQRPVNSVIR